MLHFETKFSRIGLCVEELERLTCRIFKRDKGQKCSPKMACSFKSNRDRALRGVLKWLLAMKYLRNIIWTEVLKFPSAVGLNIWMLRARRRAHTHARRYQSLKKYKNLRPKIFIEYYSLALPTPDSIGLLGWSLLDFPRFLIMCLLHVQVHARVDDNLKNAMMVGNCFLMAHFEATRCPMSYNHQ